MDRCLITTRLLNIWPKVSFPIRPVPISVPIWNSWLNLKHRFIFDYFERFLFKFFFPFHVWCPRESFQSKFRILFILSHELKPFKKHLPSGFLNCAREQICTLIILYLIRVFLLLARYDSYCLKYHILPLKLFQIWNFSLIERLPKLFEIVVQNNKALCKFSWGCCVHVLYMRTNVR